MFPLLSNEEIIKVYTDYYDKNSVELGDVVLLKHPYIKDFFIIKMITKISDEKIFVEGINKNESTDSRHFGELYIKNIIGFIEKYKV